MVSSEGDETGYVLRGIRDVRVTVRSQNAISRGCNGGHEELGPRGPNMSPGEKLGLMLPQRLI